MNWFVSEPVSADSMVQAGLPYLEVFCALVGVVAILMLLITLLHTILKLARRIASIRRGEAGTPDAGPVKESAAGRALSGLVVYSLIADGNAWAGMTRHRCASLQCWVVCPRSALSQW